MRLCTTMVFILLLFTSIASETPKTELHLTISRSRNYEYFYDLIKSSLELSGFVVTIEVLPAYFKQKRVMVMLEADDRVSLMWRGQSPKHDKKYAFVDFPVTKGLKGKRVFFIPQGTQELFDSVQNLDEFRDLNMVGGFGKGWSDVAIWKHNNLKTYEKDGSVDPELYKMLASQERGVHYFSRGIIEIVTEAPKFPYLDVEKNLLFIYKRDFRIYLSKSNEWLKPILESAFKEAEKTGLLDTLLTKHFSAVYDEHMLNMNGRTKIYLSVPW